MISSSRLRRRKAYVLRSQVALELALSLLAVAAGLAVVRVLFLAVELPEQSWARSVVSSVTAPLVLPLQALPGGSRPLIGAASQADITIAVMIVAIPLFVLSRSART